MWAEKQSIKYHEQPGTLGAQKEDEKSPETKLKVMGDRDLKDRELEIAVMKKLNGMQENSERQLNELRNKINEQKGVLYQRD